MSEVKLPKPVMAVLVEDLYTNKQPGQFQFWEYTEASGKRNTTAGLHFWCPCGCGSLHGIAFENGGHAKWTWDGNREAPDCNPSILEYEQDGKTPHWHGYLRHGYFINA